MNKLFLNILFFTLCNYFVTGQSLTDDLLQIKVYTIANFGDSKLKDIEVTKVFCDYCSPSQLKAIGDLAVKISKNKVKEPENRLENGQKKFTLNIRVTKKDFTRFK
jgi:hypothetical protein